jgi:hypothetical protein
VLSFTSVPADVELRLGTSAVRLHSVSVSGAVTAKIFWKPIGTL